MNNQATINNMLESADEALKVTEIVSNNGEVKDVFKGYISGFGPSVIQSGLLPALAFYLADEKGSKDKPALVIDAIAKVLYYKYAAINGKDLFKKCIDATSPALKNNFMYDIVNASVALKIMMRTYRFVETPNK